MAIFVPASRSSTFPAAPWKEWTAEARSIKKYCSAAKTEAEKAERWARAEESDAQMALWAAAFARCAQGRGRWVLEDLAQKRLWLSELQGKPAAATEYVN